MSVREKNNKFIIDYYPHGRGKRVQMVLPASVDNLLDAKNIEKELRQKAKKPGFKYTDTAKVQDLKDDFLDNFIDVERSRNTAKDYRWVFNAALKFFDNFQIQDLTPGHITLYKKTRQVDVANKTINKELSYFSVFITWAYNAKGIAPETPLMIKQFSYKRPIPLILSYDEIILFIKACEPFYQLFFLTEYCLGLRLDETRQLKKTDINFASSSVRILGKGSKERLVPCPEWLMKSYKQAIKLSDKDVPWLFPSPRDSANPIYNVRKAIKRAKAICKITKPIYPHILRHSIATHLLQGGADLETVRKFLGHESIETTTIYTHVDIEDLRRASERLQISKFMPKSLQKTPLKS